MPTVRYTTVNGQIIAEKRDGVRKSYVPDPLGSTAFLLDNTQTKTDSFTYWPFGEERTRTGSTPTPFRYVGTLGYRRDDAMRNYVRARNQLPAVARWSSVDPVGGESRPFVYCSNSPEYASDASGLQDRVLCRLREDWPGGPYAYARFTDSVLSANSLLSFSVCCNGRITICVASRISPCSTKCTIQHEGEHIQQYPECRNPDYHILGSSDKKQHADDEKKAYLVGLACRASCCSSETGVARKWCFMYLCGDCGELKKIDPQFSDPNCKGC